MTDEQRNYLERRFKGKPTIECKYVPKIPMQAEREYIRLTRQYVSLVKEVLEEDIQLLKEEYKKIRDAEVKNRRNDGLFDIILAVNKLFTKMQNDIATKTEGFGLRRRLENLSHLTRKLTVKEWKKAVSVTLGINLYEDYYLGEFYKTQMLQWVDYNCELIKTIPHDCLAEVKESILYGFENGLNTTTMLKDIQRIYGVSRRRARFIARDQIAKLNGQIQRHQQMDAGIEHYIWDTSGDSRVRPSHKALDGKMFSWSEAPINADGRQCHPGEDYNCRCVGRPVFSIETLNLPIQDAS